jgi:hypothetical protein
MRHSQWFEYESNIHRAAEAIVDHALRITTEHGPTPSLALDRAISSTDFPTLRAR